MAGMKGLVDSSASCGDVNPLMKLTTHFSQDRGKTDAGFSRQKPLESTSGGALEEEFLRFQHRSQPQTFHLKDLLSELDSTAAGSSASAAWKSPLDIQWTKEFQNTKDEGILQPMPMLQTKIMSESWAQDYLKEIPVLQANGSSEALKLHDTLNQDPRFSESEFQAFLKSESGKAEEWAQDFETMQGTASGTQKLAGQDQWVEEFVDMTDQDVEAAYKSDFWSNLEDQWKSMDKEEHPWLDDFEQFNFLTEYGKYEFQAENELKNTSASECLEEGKKKLAEGDLPSAVLYFEAAAQQNPQNAEAWSLLGTSQAKNEQDPSAISALMHAIKLDPGNRDAIISLAASLTNESMQSHACYALQDWISAKSTGAISDVGATSSGTASASITASEATEHLQILSTKITSSFMSRELHQQTLDRYLNLARAEHQSGAIDPDVQCGLGILLNLSGDYTKAADCFRAALSVKPDDALLWNRLGATLANGDRSEEAIGAYRKALDIYPGFVRARYNLGISCINLKTYDMAVEHFLSALNFQSQGRGLDSRKSDSKVMSDNIWSSLRLTLGLKGQRELYSAIEDRNLDELNRVFNKVN